MKKGTNRRTSRLYKRIGLRANSLKRQQQEKEKIEQENMEKEKIKKIFCSPPTPYHLPSNNYNLQPTTNHLPPTITQWANITTDGGVRYFCVSDVLEIRLSW